MNSEVLQKIKEVISAYAVDSPAIASILAHPKFLNEIAKWEEMPTIEIQGDKIVMSTSRYVPNVTGFDFKDEKQRENVIYSIDNFDGKSPSYLCVDRYSYFDHMLANPQPYEPNAMGSFMESRTLYDADFIIGSQLFYASYKSRENARDARGVNISGFLAKYRSTPELSTGYILHHMQPVGSSDFDGIYFISDVACRVDGVVYRSLLRHDKGQDNEMGLYHKELSTHQFDSYYPDSLLTGPGYSTISYSSEDHGVINGKRIDKKTPETVVKCYPNGVPYTLERAIEEINAEFLKSVSKGKSL